LIKRSEVDVKHPDWEKRQDLYKKLYVMYEGGQVMAENAPLFLTQRPREDGTVYAYRLQQFCYENHLGTGLGWHEAEMFRVDPAITFPDASEDQKAWYDNFLANCDCKGTGLIDAFRTVFTHLLLYQHSWILTDLPTASEGIDSLADQKQKGLLDPYIKILHPSSVINWDCDEHGNFNWAVVYSNVQQQQFMSKPVRLERWYYYDRHNFSVYESRNVAGDSSKDVVELVDGPRPHALSKAGKVPLRRACVQSGWWMGNRSYLAATEHINVSNALKWSLFMAALAQPVVITDADIGEIVSAESSFIKLPQGSDYKFAEPAGNCWKFLAERADTLKEEIFRSMYLIAQARTNSATASAASGVSKEQDMRPSHDVLNGLGDVLRTTLQGVIADIGMARNQIPGLADELGTVDVRGFQFEEPITQEDVNTLSGAYALKVPSRRLEKELDKQVSRKLLPDLNQDVQTEIDTEIEAAPTREELAAQQREEEARLMSDKFSSAVA
jgi:hypothetical protein